MLFTKCCTKWLISFKPPDTHGEVSCHPGVLGRQSELGKGEWLPMFTQWVSDGAGVWAQVCLAPSPFPTCALLPGYCSCVAASPPLISASWLSVLAWSTCCSGTCLGQVFCLNLDMLLRMNFGVSPAAPRTRVRETRFLPWPEDRLLGMPSAQLTGRGREFGHTLYLCLWTLCRA